MGADIIKVYQ